MLFSNILYNISRRCKEKNIAYLIKKGKFFSTERRVVLERRRGIMGENPSPGDNPQPEYKSYKGHNLSIIYENEFFLVVNKPYDIKLEKGKLDDVYPSVETLLRQKTNLDVFRICGQLDYATSGLLIIAKDKLSCNILNYNIESKRISKIYLAILYGHLPLGVLHVNTPISKIKNNFKMKLCYNYNDYYDTGKYCYSLIYPYKQCYLKNQKVTLCELRTITGRRHQLRLHALCLGSGIVGDETYFEDMISNKYKIGSTSNPCEERIGLLAEEDQQDRFLDTQVGRITKIDAERMMLHCWIILKNKADQKKELKKTEDINMLEKKIFDQDYIICPDEISKFVNEEERTYDQCVLKNDDIVNNNFVNYNVKNINKNIKNIDRRLNRGKRDPLLRNSDGVENSNKLEDSHLLNREEADKNGKGENNSQGKGPSDKEQIHQTDSVIPTEEQTDQQLHPNNVQTVDVTEKFINAQEVDKNAIYLVKNDMYEDPNLLFDDIHDSVNKFNWG
ncbi:ribosomal large subunit pseudouridylate synthase, putative [Plasmodium knowlesi strain H]|uniref:Ribosomal large subunit pseudouridylate synthase, putative n=3 Tax=Plasmodium knowlesi TaxID=5850 RepID=A0A5K1UBG9_PLAKH|nr:ribosomal large subunit pseudouridylate synthase, putative [Plasmodium knowlesi strain H]OTN66995.1 putative Ribosomal large subunit pseudouridylate synthase [Plasmodium knowlesi]CAA9988620.1 ribosomal large subunit pseudouridylate synthase, putative [Plasmodium knowlesi strain H]SBO21462.1 ribosomal large subunit pseudouridylate synthase, putative [Plasmodium knowlesi strain H]SBO21894.1 ribosomal large subunit pseudouridylate synthase, putative [Plasmodium knowlesi strain H]VVS78094.1 rib|eukprot:XP_002259596.1 ribosomal large subunit pseudouridylate synthase, putative [Plasmodium knowlesi strain H]